MDPGSHGISPVCTAYRKMHANRSYFLITQGFRRTQPLRRLGELNENVSELKYGGHATAIRFVTTKDSVGYGRGSGCTAKMTLGIRRHHHSSIDENAWSS
ncbi:hypothetical protein [Burkholderia pseudomallei]|uniref:hypothetical protein n=1 Tax=Burkholderia pseudomallei TaxID=28450 RepID=UPI0011787652|nr:hypothetical protein [Burkholderia pseudomallei]MBM5649456.1 hypothetical protein [Burkholderia pseudomallei]